MAINLVIAVTDGDWFDMLRRQPNLAEVNFWAPSAANFRALQPGELFLFKLPPPGRRTSTVRRAAAHPAATGAGRLSGARDGPVSATVRCHRGADAPGLGGGAYSPLRRGRRT